MALLPLCWHSQHNVAGFIIRAANKVKGPKKMLETAEQCCLSANCLHYDNQYCDAPTRDVD